VVGEAPGAPGEVVLLVTSAPFYGGGIYQFQKRIPFTQSDGSVEPPLLP
jgi:hypothetical protein